MVEYDDMFINESEIKKLSSKEPVSSFLDKIFGKNDNVTDEIINIVNEGQEQGELLDSEAKMITNIIEFGDKEAQDIMTHRKNVVAIDADTTIREAFDIILEENYSRFPVYDEDVDHIIGVLHIRDFFKIYADTYKRNHTIRELKEDMLFEPFFIPETRNINDLFKAMQSNKVHMAVVLDEYGQNSGIVTMEDVLEEIVGNIMDEYDEEEPLIVKHTEGNYTVDGLTPLEDVEEEIEVNFEEEEIDTLGGFIVSKMEKIPEKGDKFVMEFQGYKFEVIEVSDKRIKKVKITKIN